MHRANDVPLKMTSRIAAEYQSVIKAERMHALILNRIGKRLLHQFPTVPESNATYLGRSSCSTCMLLPGDCFEVGNPILITKGSETSKHFRRVGSFVP
jgi:hypothetical protein